jgi:pimeloyl-ACP methyl ester carboxylesterase
MAILFLIRTAFGLLSLAVLALGGYWVWSWFHGNWIMMGGDPVHVRGPDWRLWAGLALLAWSLSGRWVVTLLVARSDSDATFAKRGQGEVRVLAGAGGADLYTETLGPVGAPVVILTHGWGLDSTIWNYAKRDLQSCRVIVWDLPGLGKSTRVEDGGVSLPNFAANLAVVMALAEGQPVVLVGHSIGGMTLQTLVRDMPELADRVSGLVLINTTYTNPLRTMVASGLLLALRRPLIEPLLHLMIWLKPLAWLSAWQSYLSGSAHLANRLGFGRFVTRSQLEHTTLLTTRNDPAVQAHGNLAMFGWDATSALADIRTPVLVIAGDVDIITKPEASEAIVGEAGCARLRVVGGVNHMGFLEQANTYNSLIAAFVLEVCPTQNPQAAARRSLEEPRTFLDIPTVGVAGPAVAASRLHDAAPPAVT